MSIPAHTGMTLGKAKGYVCRLLVFAEAVKFFIAQVRQFAEAQECLPPLIACI